MDLCTDGRKLLLLARNVGRASGSIYEHWSIMRASVLEGFCLRGLLSLYTFSEILFPSSLQNEQVAAAEMHLILRPCNLHPNTHGNLNSKKSKRIQSIVT